jgi:hypothetical protein
MVDPKEAEHLRVAMVITVPVAHRLQVDLMARLLRTDPAGRRLAGRKARMARANSNNACVPWDHRPSR